MRRAVAAALIFLLPLFGTAAADEPENLAGRILVADEGMRDPRFVKTIVYIVRHNEDGAFGLVVNRPLLRIPEADVFDQLGLDPPDDAATIEFHFGGPVQSGVGYVLHSGDFVTEGTMSVEDGLAVSGIRGVLDATAKGTGPDRVMFALGYSGWAPDQLEGEIARGDWVSIDGDEALVFDVPFAERWAAAIARRGLDL